MKNTPERLGIIYQLESKHFIFSFLIVTFLSFSCMNIYVMAKGGHQENYAKWIIADQFHVLLEYLHMKQKFDIYF